MGGQRIVQNVAAHKNKKRKRGEDETSAEKREKPR